MQTPATTARAAAWAALGVILDQRRTMDEAMQAVAMNVSDSERPFMRMLLLSTLRHLGQIDALLTPLLHKPLPPKHRAVMHALRLGAVQLRVMQTPAHAAVHETVAMVKHSPHDALAGMVNAVLKQLPAALPDCRHNLPVWLEQRWKAQYGKAVSDTICRVAAQRPPLDLHSAASFDDGARLDEVIWRMGADHKPVPELAGYDAGAFFVQDMAASYPVRMLGDVAGKTVLDIGAAPGGKTAQMARAGAVVTALDQSPRRMARLRENMQRLRCDVQTVVADAMTYAPAHGFDIVLLDAPCSATGTWRRHPEVVHITTADDITEMAAMQRALLARAWGWVKPGGRLLYCVCSLEREEGEDQAAWFAATHTDAALVHPHPTLSLSEAEGRALDRGEGAYDIQPATITPEGYLRTTPALLETHGGMDGFFAALFTKN